MQTFELRRTWILTPSQHLTSPRLHSVLDHEATLPYVVVELGARYGTWAVRCVKALQVRACVYACMRMPSRKPRIVNAAQYYP